MANTLPGIGFRDPSLAVLIFDPPTYTKLVADTLGNHGLPGDDLELAQTELSALMDAFTADVTNDTLIPSLPQGSIFGGTIAALALIGAELDAADALHAGIGAAFDILGASLGVWGVLDDIISLINVKFNYAITYANQLFLSSVYNPFPPGPGITGF